MDTERYQGTGQPPPGAGTDKIFPYRADAGLKRAVNMAITLKRPLLVKGDPGCGKTRLAASIAHELGLPLFEWHVKSTSRAHDGLYTIDMVRRLQDAQRQDPKAQRLRPYLSFGELAQAFMCDTEAVVLIDEIDKADIDFPNDLLRELEEKKFTIRELHETYEARHAPIVVITSNDEKELPDAFLRRCLFYHITFPGPKDLENIVRVNLEDLGLKVEEALIAQAAKRLHELRDLGGYRKKPATSELIDWVRILHHWNVTGEHLKQADGLKAVLEQEEVFHWKVLFKHLQDQQRAERYAEEAA